MASKIGTEKSEKILGTQDNDNITGLGGADTLDGQAGNDVLGGGDGNDSLIGGNGNDELIGGNGKDRLIAGSGDDKLDGGADNDRLDGDAGKDTLEGGKGVDTMIGGDGDDYYFVDNIKDVVTERNKISVTGGIDTVETILPTYKLTNNVENLILAGIDNIKGNGNKSNNTITGNIGDNFLFGDAGNDSLVGNDGEDTLDGGLGMDTLVGGAGNDVYFMNNTEDTIIETEDGGDLDQVNATVSFELDADSNIEALQLSGAKATSGVGNSLDNFIFVEEGSKTSVELQGMDGDDTLISANGDDTLEGGRGDDSIDGGEGEDTVIFNGLKNEYEFKVNVDAENVPQIVVRTVDGASLNEGEDILTNIEILQFSDGTTLNAADILEGNFDPTDEENIDEEPADEELDDEKPVEETKPAPVENLKSSLPKDTRTYDYELPLTEEADPMEGSALNEKILGLGGADTLNGKEGNDYLDGGLGDDSLIGGTGDDYILGNDGNDSIDGGDGNDSIDGGIGDNYIRDEHGNNTIATGSGNDNIEFYDGNNVIDTGEGNDTISGHYGFNSYYLTEIIVNAGDGNDSVNGGANIYSIIHGNKGNDHFDSGGAIFGDEGDDYLRSSVSGSTLDGGDGNDIIESYYAWDQILIGGKGRDTLKDLDYENDRNQLFIGGTDADTITTVDGKDIIEYDTIKDSGVGAGNRDIITDFDTSSGDVIDLYRLSDVLTFLGMKTLDGTKGAVSLKVDAPNKQTIVQIDMNGDKMPEMEIELTGIKILAADDFILSAPRV